MTDVVTPIRTRAYRDLVVRACEYLTSRQEVLRVRYKLGANGRYDWDMDKGVIVFSNRGRRIASATIHFVGSVATGDGTWLWSWANDSYTPRVKNRMLTIRRFGLQWGIPQLVEHCWDGNEVDGWEMTSLAAYIMKSSGAYRVPFENGFIYMLLSDIRPGPGSPSDRSRRSNGPRIRSVSEAGRPTRFDTRPG
jgi:hypothetical protein